MRENRKFFRADVDIKIYFRPINSDELEYWTQQIDLGCHEDLCRTYLAGEAEFLKGVANLSNTKDDIKDLILFLNEKVNYVLKASSMMKDHPLSSAIEESVNLGGGGCALMQDFSMSLNSRALLEIILPRNNKYIRALLKSVHSAPAGNKWRNRYCFEKISTEDQDAIIGYLFQAEALEKLMSDTPHESTDNTSPYN